MAAFIFVLLVVVVSCTAISLASTVGMSRRITELENRIESITKEK